MAQVTKQPADADSQLDEALPNTNYGSNTKIIVASDSTVLNDRGIFKFDFSGDISAGATIDSAVMSPYKYWYDSSDASGRTYGCYRITQTAWVEGEVTWNSYSSGNSWSSGGGDYTATDKATAVVPANNNWHDFTVTDQVQTALDSVSGVAHFLIRDETEDSWTRYGAWYYSSDAASANKPKLVIDYTEGTTYPVTGTIAAVSGLSGSVTAKMKATGTIPAVSGLSGSVTAKMKATGAIPATSGASLNVTSKQYVTGTIPAVSGVSGSVTLKQYVTGTIPAISGINGSVYLVQPITGTIPAISGLSGSVTAKMKVTGTIPAISGVNGSVIAKMKAAGTIPAVSGLNGNVTAWQMPKGLGHGNTSPPKTGSLTIGRGQIGLPKTGVIDR